jgi:arylsulfatase A-like enzyme
MVRTMLRRARAILTGTILLGVCALFGCRGPALPAQPHVVVFLLDAARADHFGSYGYGRDTTPHADAFARGATRYTQAISEGAYTYASIAALFTGQPPERTGLLEARLAERGRFELLAQVARAAGYRTYGYSENPYVSRDFALDEGFDVFDPAFRGRDPRGLPALDGEAGIDAALDFLAQGDSRPLFAYLHLIRPHNPYAPTPAQAGRFGSHDPAAGSTAALRALDRRGAASARELGNTVALYDENLASADAAFGRLIRGLGERGLEDETVVVLASDHGEAFLEHERMLHNTTVYDEMIHVPLLVRVPGQPPGVVDSPVQLADLGAVLRALVRGEAGSAQRLTALARRDDAPTFSWTVPAAARVGVRTREHKLVADARDLGELAVYDLERDPGEQHPLHGSPQAAPLLQQLRERVADGPLAGPTPVAPRLAPDLERRLEALGYTQD